MKYLLLDRLIDIVGHRPDENTLRQGRNFRWRDERIKLRIGRGGHAFGRYRIRFSALHDFSEPLGERSGRVSHDLSGKDVAHGIDDDLGLLISIVAFELREILKT